MTAKKFWLASYERDAQAEKKNPFLGCCVVSFSILSIDR